MVFHSVPKLVKSASSRRRTAAVSTGELDAHLCREVAFLWQ
jgi:hypothetical protein